MNVFLDDERPCPAGWKLLDTSDQLIRFVKENGSKIELISLDHDLGERTDTGYHFCLWLENEYMTNYKRFKDWKFKITVHSANPVGRIKMETVLKRLGLFIPKEEVNYAHD